MKRSGPDSRLFARIVTFNYLNASRHNPSNIHLAALSILGFINEGPLLPDSQALGGRV
jgi:hypothetical protein